MTAPEAAGDMRAIAQPVSAPLTRAAIFMIVFVPLAGRQYKRAVSR